MRALLVLAAAHPGRSLLMLLSLLLAGAVGGVGIFTVLPVLGLAIGARGGAEATGPGNPFEERLLGFLASLGLEPTIGTLLGVVAVAMTTKGVLTLLANIQVGYAVARAATDLRLGLLRSLLEARWTYFTRRPVGSFGVAFVSEAARAARGYQQAANVVAALIETAVSLGIALAVSWRMTLGTLALGGLFLLSRNFLVRMTRKAGRRQTHLLRSTLSRLTDVLQGVKALKAMAREPRVEPLLGDLTLRINRALRKLVVSREALRSLEEPIISLYLCGGLFLALAVWSLPLDEVLVLALVFARMLVNLGSVQGKYQQMAAEESAYESLQKTIGEARAEREHWSGTREPRLERAVELRDVHLAYDGQPVLRDASLELPVGELTALIGSSGAGKSTVVDILVGLVVPQQGQVLVDGVPLTEIDLRAWRSRLGYVPQEMFLFHDTVATNVSLGDPEIGAEDVERALRAARAWEFVSALPEGVDSMVGERGTLLSGGQRQRISLARAIVHRPALLVLDEITAALDPDTERAIWAAVAGLRGSTTILAISHQPSLAAVADRIYRIEGGRIHALPVAAPGSASAGASV